VRPSRTDGQVNASERVIGARSAGIGAAGMQSASENIWSPGKTIRFSAPVALPAGGGLNLAEIGLNYVDASTEYGNYVASYVVLGDNSYEPAVPACIDGDLQTHTTMGNTVGSTERLRLTLGFNSSSGVPK